MSGQEESFEAAGAMAGQRELEYFAALYEAERMETEESRERTLKKWDKRAEAWEAERREGRREPRDERLISTVEYLKSRSLLTSKQTVADIGCGPGRFAAEFGKTAGHVTGFDLSEKMIGYGREYVRRAGLANVSLRCLDFGALDVKKEGLSRSFDLVVASLTPALGKVRELEKMMEMSRAFCFSVSYISSTRPLEEALMGELFGRMAKSRGNGRQFYALFNFLFLKGYLPEATYYNRREERRIFPDDDYIEGFMEDALYGEERTEENREKVKAWLRNRTEADGAIRTINTSCYGRLLWDVRQKREGAGW